MLYLLSYEGLVVVGAVGIVVAVVITVIVAAALKVRPNTGLCCRFDKKPII